MFEKADETRPNGWRPREQRFGLMIESLVAILLLVTIGYCVILNAVSSGSRPTSSRLKATISELITATEIAERADRRTESDRARGRPARSASA